MASSRKKPAKAPRKVRKTPPKAPGKPEEHGETCLQLHCRQWLEKTGIWYRLLIFHVPNQRKGGIGAGVFFKRMGVRAGVADWLAFPPGRGVAIELKDDEGSQRKEQEVFQRDWEEAGNVYVICRTLEEFQGAVHAIMLFV